MNLFDQALAFIAPSHALKRMQKRVAIDAFNDYNLKKRRYEGATRGKRLGNWGLNQNSPNFDITQALPDLRSRARELCQNNPYAKNAPGRIANNVIGTGILLTPVSTTGNKAAEEAFKKSWSAFAGSTACDFNDQLNLYGLQSQIMRSVVKNGEALVQRVKKRYKKGEIPFELKVLNPALLNHLENRVDIDGGGYIMAGKEFNKAGKLVAYYIWDRDPAEFIAETKRIPAEDICHIYDVDDAGQVRGLPFFSSIILRMKDFDEYEDAQLLKQKTSACYSLWRTKPQLDTVLNVDPKDKDSDGNVYERVFPGMVGELRAGESITVAQPPTTEGFSEYSRQNLQGQAIGIGMSYEAFTGDLANVNFSSGRMGWIEFQRNIEHWQWNMIIPMFLEKVFKWFLEAAFLAKEIPSIEFKATWTPPRREMIDPVKEAKAMVQMIRAGIISLSEAQKQLGYVPDEVFAELVKDKKMLDELGLMLDSDPRFDPERMNKQQQNKTP